MFAGGIDTLHEVQAEGVFHLCGASAFDLLLGIFARASASLGRFRALTGDNRGRRLRLTPH